MEGIAISILCLQKFANEWLKIKKGNVVVKKTLPKTITKTLKKRTYCIDTIPSIISSQEWKEHDIHPYKLLIAIFATSQAEFCETLLIKIQGYLDFF